MPAFRHEGGHEGVGAESRQSVARAHLAQERWRVRSAGRGRNSRDLCAARYPQPGGLWRTAGESAHPSAGAAVERSAEVDRQPGHVRRSARSGAALPALRSQEGTRMSEDRIVRYTFRERVMHWLAGFTYLYLLISGLAFFAPQLYLMAAILG